MCMHASNSIHAHIEHIMESKTIKFEGKIEIVLFLLGIVDVHRTCFTYAEGEIGLFAYLELNIKIKLLNDRFLSDNK